MKYIGELSKLKTFKIEDLNNFTNDYNLSNKTIQNYLKKGLIKRIKMNLYSVVSYETNDTIANKYDIASSITPSSFLSHHSAFEFYGYYNQVYDTVDVSSLTKFNTFEFNDNLFLYTPTKHENFVNIINGIKVTSLERTVVDCINSSGIKCDLEETMNCISSITYLSHKKMLDYLHLLDNKMLYKKVGIIMFVFKDQFKFPNSFFDTCHKKSDMVKGYFENKNKESLTYNSEWKIFIYKNFDKYINKE